MNRETLEIIGDLLKLATCISAWGIVGFFLVGRGNGLRRALLGFFLAQAALWTLVVLQRIPGMGDVLASTQPWLGLLLLMAQALAFAGLTWGLYMRRLHA